MRSLISKRLPVTPLQIGSKLQVESSGRVFALCSGCSGADRSMYSMLQIVLAASIRIAPRLRFPHTLRAACGGRDSSSSSSSSSSSNNNNKRKKNKQQQQQGQRSIIHISTADFTSARLSPRSFSYATRTICLPTIGWVLSSPTMAMPLGCTKTYWCSSEAQDAQGEASEGDAEIESKGKRQRVNESSAVECSAM